VSATQRLYPLYDGHGSKRTVTNGSETVIGTVNVEAFGQTAGYTGSSSSPCMYAGAWGYRTDGDAGLMHVGARYYDAQVGRFITRDTVLSEHPYLYCEHDPVKWVDPGGQDRTWDGCWDNIRAAIGIGGGAWIGGRVGGTFGSIGGPIGSGIGFIGGGIIGYWWPDIWNHFTRPRVHERPAVLSPTPCPGIDPPPPGSIVPPAPYMGPPDRVVRLDSRY